MADYQITNYTNRCLILVLVEEMRINCLPGSYLDFIENRQANFAIKSNNMQ